MHQTKPLVSIVVSAYNRPRMLKEALQSVLSQTYTHLQILIQDDSTTEDCARLVATFTDPRICYQHNRPSLGTGLNQRAGYRRANGAYLCTLNDDDLLLPKYLDTMVAGLEAHPECSLAFSDHAIVDADGAVDAEASDHNAAHFGRTRLSAGVIQEPLQPAILDKSVPGMFAVFRRSCLQLEDFPDEVSSGYDYWLTYLAARTGRPMFYDPERLTRYRVHDEAQTTSFLTPQHRLRFLAYELFISARMLADPRLAPIHAALQDRAAALRVFQGNANLLVGNGRSARADFAAAFRSGRALRALFGFMLSFLPSALLCRVLRSSGQARTR